MKPCSVAQQALAHLRANNPEGALAALREGPVQHLSAEALLAARRPDFLVYAADLLRRIATEPRT
jgi:hypothetical protein